jgi:hypothetical protein
MSGVERFGSNLTLLSLSFARRGDGNLTLSLCDVPLLRKERDVLATPKQGEVRTGGRETAVSTRSEKPHPVCFADIPLLQQGGDVLAVAETG